MAGKRSPSAAVQKARFNLDLAAYTHPSWAGPVVSLAHDGRWRRSGAVSRWLAEEAGVAGVFDWRMKETAKRVFLLDRPDIDRVALELGAALQRRAIGREVRRDRVLALREAFGPALLDFVLDSAAHLPPVDTAAGPAELVDASALRVHAHRLGAQALWKLLDPAWTAVRGRSALLFEREWRIQSLEPHPRNAHKAVVAFLLDTLFPKRMPECGWLF